MAEEQWHYFPRDIWADPAFVLVNTGIADAIDSAPGGLVTLELVYKNPTEKGLPTSGEYEPVFKIENRIEEQAKSWGDVYVGRITHSGRRVFYIYTQKQKPEWESFNAQLASGSGYAIKVSYREDPGHEAYHNDLYPTQDDWVVIKDLGVIESLNDNGDDGSAPRRIDHWVFFENKSSSVDFVIWAENDRFTEKHEESGEMEDGRYCVRLYHDGTAQLPDISSHTLALSQKAREYGGEYDGWETVVCRAEHP